MRKYLFLLVMVPGLLLFSCKGKTDDSSNLDPTESKVDTTKERKRDGMQVFYSPPSPIETALHIKNSGVEFRDEYLNPLENAAKYETSSKIALNIGIYSADLAFAGLYGKNNITLNYIKTTKELADKLNIAQAVDQKDIERLEKYVTNEDSLYAIIQETYMNLNSYLKEDGRSYAVALIFAGAYIEGFYIATQIAKNTPDNKDLELKIFEQRLSLDILIDYLKQEETEDSSTPELIADLEDLKDIFADATTTEKTDAEPKVESGDGVNVIKTGKKSELNPDALGSIYAKVEEIRNGITE